MATSEFWSDRQWPVKRQPGSSPEGEVLWTRDYRDNPEPERLQARRPTQRVFGMPCWHFAGSPAGILRSDCGSSQGPTDAAASALARRQFQLASISRLPRPRSKLLPSAAEEWFHLRVATLRDETRSPRASPFRLLPALLRWPRTPVDLASRPTVQCWFVR
jgi:hypothetical protein